PHSRHLPALHSFPTRRSSDLAVSTERRNDVVVSGATIGSVITVLPQNASITNVTGLDGTTVGRIEVHAPVASATNDWLHVITQGDRKSTRLNSSHRTISYAVF